MNIQMLCEGISIIQLMLNIFGFAFTFALTGYLYAHFKVIRMSTKRNVYPPPDVCPV